MKPIIFYVDDEPHNLTVFEAALPEDWDIHTFDNPLSALEAIEQLRPAVIVSDQRMPGMVGVRFLELAKKLSPHSRRVLVTGYSEEDLVVESVRTAQVSDYIRKPWDPDDLEIRMRKVVETYNLEMSLRDKQEALTQQNLELTEKTKELEEARVREKDLRKELECWVPPFVTEAIKNKEAYPMKRDLALITFDIIDSAKLHGLFVEGRAVRSLILKEFSALTIKHGGWRESHSGDSAYSHFGLMSHVQQPCDAAYSVASEFRLFLRNFCRKNQLEIECGIGLHLARECFVEIHEVHYALGDKMKTQRSFDTSSADVDLVHRMEKHVHSLPGTNIVLSEQFFNHLTNPPVDLIPVGEYLFKGQKEPISMFLKKSDMVTQEEALNILKEEKEGPENMKVA